MTLRVLAAILWAGLISVACESSPVQPQPESWPSSVADPARDEPTVAPEPVTALESASAMAPADTSEPPLDRATPSPELPVQAALPPPPPPKLRAQLSGLEALVEGTELVVRAELSGQLDGSEVPVDRVEVVVDLHGPSGRELLSRDGGPLQLKLAVQEQVRFRVGAVQGRLEGRLLVDDLALEGEGLHQIVPEMQDLAMDSVVLQPQEQFPYVWITRSKDEATPSSGINDARVLGPKR